MKDKIKSHADNFFESEAEMDIKYPNRHITIHKHCCKNCPSAHGSDPMADDLKEFTPKEERHKFVFVCAWRRSKLCKGICDFMEVTEESFKKSTPIIKQ